MKIAKKVKKSYKKTNKALGLNWNESRKLKKAIGDMAYDVAVNTISTLCVDAAYGIINTVYSAGCTVVCVVADKVKKPEIADATEADDFLIDEEEFEESEE